MERVPESCADVLSNLPLYVGADLEPEVQAAVDNHLAACSECRMAADRVQASRQVLWSEFAETEVPAELDLWAGLRPQLADEGLFAGVPARRPIPMWRVASYAAAAALLFSVTVLQFTGSGSATIVPVGDAIASPAGPAGPGIPTVTAGDPSVRPEFHLRDARQGEVWLYDDVRSFNDPAPLRHVHSMRPGVTGQPRAEAVIFAPQQK